LCHFWSSNLLESEPGKLLPSLCKCQPLPWNYDWVSLCAQQRI
jgi:hypothetical protein